MENVVAFNNELSGLYDTKPPISKAKMAAITKAAMRAIKFYKHVVQSVEKFILKCKPEYKVPGLYVIDSIVRQSRHQYGPEKDVFAPRFARNMKETFANLFRCASEDKSRIIRVLNLWQKNSVFAPEVIQPIFDLADPNHPIYQMPPSGGMQVGTGVSADNSNGANGIGSAMDNNNSLNASTSNMNMSLLVDDKNGAALPDLSNNNLKQLLNDPNVLRQLQTLQNFTKFKQQEDNKHHKLSEMRMQEDAFEKHLQNVLKSSGATNSQESNEYNAEVEFVSMEQNIEVINLDGNDSRSPSPERDRYKRRRSRSNSQRRDRRGNSRERRRRSRSRSTERSRSPRLNRRRNSRERDRERNSRDSRDTREKERDREHERERRKKGLPELKKEHLSVCSTTLWVGHLSKLVYQEELSDTFGEFGDIVSIDQIVPRGCAFIVMHRRQDAYKAMQNLKNHKLQGRAITISWAAGKGVKSKEWKDYWDLELGVTYIPWNKLDENTDFDSMEEGGMFDEDSMPTWMKEKIQLVKSQRDKRNEHNNQTGNMPGGGNLLFGIDTTQPPPGPPSLMSMALPGQFPMAPPISAPPRPLMGPMGMPLQGLSMPPNLMTGMHPPHAMMMPPGMMPPGFPMPQSGPPPLNASPMGMPPPNAPPFAAAATAAIPTPAAPSVANNSSDDQMDIVMDDDESVAPVISGGAPAMQSQLNFNQPPPMFNNNNMNAMSSGNNTESNGTAEIFSRDRNRSSSRWSGCNRVGEDGDEGKDIWRENNAGNFNENRLVGNNTHRPDFMNDNRNRAAVGAGSRGPDFFPNMPPNRFNQPTSLLQMRIAPPPNMFNPRMGGPKGGGPGPGPGPMFMRGGPQGGGGRQQAPGFFNARNPFSDGGRGGMGRGGRMMDNRGNRGGRNSYGSNNWSDEEGDDNVFKRRGGNRFRDDERNHRGARPQGAGDWGHQRNERRGGGEFVGNRRNSRNLNEEEKQNETNSPGAVDSKTQNNSCDTEDDWDRELEEYDARMENAEKNNEDNMNVNKSQTIENLEENANKDGIPESSTNDVTNDVMPIFDELQHSHVNDVVSHTSAKDFEEEIVQNQPINERELNSPPELHDMIMEPEVTSAQVPVPIPVSVAVNVSENLELAQE